MSDSVISDSVMGKIQKQLSDGYEASSTLSWVVWERLFAWPTLRSNVTAWQVSMRQNVPIINICLPGCCKETILLEQGFVFLAWSKAVFPGPQVAGVYTICR
jgi:hypothetical protein